MYQLIILGIYLAVLLVIFIFIAIVAMHIGEFRQYSRYLSLVLKLYLITVLCISAFGAYKILTSTYLHPKKNPSQSIQKTF